MHPVKHIKWFKAKLFLYVLTHWGRVTHKCAIDMSHLWFRYWLVAYSAPNHYLNQCWNIVGAKLGNKCRRNLKRDSYICIKENAFENVVWVMVAILSRSQYAKHPSSTAASHKLLQYTTKEDRNMGAVLVKDILLWLNSHQISCAHIFISVARSFWNFVHHIPVILPCLLHANLKTNWQ